ncbi:hypothetical protein SFRURICE_004419 [Spodoptera frugiperda]|nr:hypothetical protein SFRURICE_004419 [Spodoptera frugiperda]
MKLESAQYMSVEKQLTLQTEELILLSTRTNNINNMSLADLFQNQNEIYDNIKKIGINIKKDGWDRKNADYFKRRKAMLENLWSEFQFNHDRLTTEQSGGHPYFANDCYNITLQCYNEVKELILQQHQQLTSLARSPREQPVQIKAAGGANQLGGEGTAADQTKQEQEASTSERAEQASDANRNREPSPSRTEQITEKKDMGSNSKLDDMMRKQTANFKAFMRAVANIHVEFLTEKWELQDALQTLQSRWSAIDNLHWEIECETNGEKMIVYDDRYTSNKKITKSFHVSTIRCPICDGEHGMYNCARFLEMPIQLKLNTVNKMNICVNCLFSHNGKKCTSAYRCRICAGQHNTLLHDAFIKNKPERPTNTSHTNSKSQNLHRCKTTNRKINFIGLVLTLLYLLNPAAAANKTNIVELQQGLYFDKVTNMQLIRGEWKIIVYYDIEPYWHGIAASRKFTNHLENICEKIKQKTQCNVILTQLQHSINEIRHYNNVLLNPQGRANTRSKRGLINGIGSVARSLFGVLDDEFAKQYQEDIDLIKVNEKHLALLLRNQTSVIEAEYNLLKRSEDAVEKQYKMFNQHLLNLEKFTTNIQKELDSQELSIEFVMSSITANSLIEHLRNVQENLIDTVTNIYNGKINLHLIAPEQLRDELNIISSQLSKDLVLPINNIQTELFHLYHLLQVKAKMTERYLIIEIKVPLINRENFEIYRTIPIPKSNDGDMVTLLPIAEMLAINIQKDSYIPMTESEIHQCIQHDTTTRLCPLQKPVYRMKSDESLCMKKREPPHCEVRHEPCRDKWFELNNANNYLYFCCQQCKIRIICGHQVSTQLLHRAGVITLHDGCIISSETFAVYPQNHQMNKMQAEVDVGPAEIPSINNIINLSVPLFKHLHENETVTEQRSLLQELGKQVEQMKAATSEDILSDHATHHDIHQYVAIYLLAAAVISAGFIYAYNRLRKHWTNQRTQEAASVPHPMPRRRSTASSVDNALFDVTDMSNTAHLSSACALDKATSPIARTLLVLYKTTILNY